MGDGNGRWSWAMERGGDENGRWNEVVMKMGDGKRW